MADPISPVASVITIAGCAIESAKFLYGVLNKFSKASAEIHQSLKTLQALHNTLVGLQQCSASLYPTYVFPPRFCQRLAECQSYLNIWEHHIREIDSEFSQKASSKRIWNGKAKRTWERFKWIAFRGRDMEKFMENMKTYESEFSLELSMQLITMLASPASLTDPSTPSNGIAQARPTAPLPRFQRAMIKSDGHIISHLTANDQHLRALAQRPDSNAASPDCGLFLEIEGRDTFSYPARYSPDSVRAVYSLRWSLLACKCVMRVGPVIVTRNSPRRSYQKTGFGFGISVLLPECCRRKFEIALYLSQILMPNRNRIAISCDLGFPRVISQDAKVFEYVRAGSTDKVKSLFSAGEASARDTTRFGITLLHTASKRDNIVIDIIRLLIQQGADVNAQDEDGETPLHGVMAKKDQYAIARLLIENGADFLNKAADGKTPLHTIFNNTVEGVLKKDEWVEEVSPDSQGMSISHFLAWSSKTAIDTFCRARMHDLTDLWSVDGFGRTCLHLATSRGNLDLLLYLLERASSFDVEIADHQGRTCLHYAPRSNEATKVISLLAAKGCNMLATDKSNWTVVDYARQLNNLGAIQKLTELTGERTSVSTSDSVEMPFHLVPETKGPIRHMCRRIFGSVGYSGSPISDQPSFCDGSKATERLATGFGSTVTKVIVGVLVGYFIYFWLRF